MSTTGCNRTGCLERRFKGSDTPLRGCGGCKKVYYCSDECQKVHWKEAHKQLCAQIKVDPVVFGAKGHAQRRKQADEAFHGLAPASERFKWGSLFGTDAKSRLARQFYETLDNEHVVQYALLQKYLEFGDKGVVLFDIDKPSGVSNGFGSFSWVPMLAAKRTRDKLLQESIRDYDPAGVACVALYSLRPDGKSMDFYLMENLFTAPDVFKRRVERMKAARREEDRAAGLYELRLD